MMMAMASTSAPSGTVMMYPNVDTSTYAGSTNVDGGGGSRLGGSSGSVSAFRGAGTLASTHQTILPTSTSTSTAPDISLRQRAVAKLRMFNFHLNWDLQMTHCKPCG